MPPARTGVGCWALAMQSCALQLSAPHDNLVYELNNSSVSIGMHCLDRVVPHSKHVHASLLLSQCHLLECSVWIRNWYEIKGLLTSVTSGGSYTVLLVIVHRPE